MTGSAGAGHESDHFLNIGAGDAHDLGYLCRSLCAAGNALIGRCFASGDSGGIAVTAGVSAAAAVCAGQTCTDFLLLGVYFNVEYLGRIGEQRAEHGAERTQHRNGEKNRFHIFTPSLSEYLHAAEAHEGESHKSSGHEADGESLEALGVLGKLNTLTHACKQDDREQEAKAAGDAVDNGFEEVVLILNVQQNDAQNGAVGGDKGQVDAQRGVQLRGWTS